MGDHHVSDISVYHSSLGNFYNLRYSIGVPITPAMETI